MTNCKKEAEEIMEFYNSKTSPMTDADELKWKAIVLAYKIDGYNSGKSDMEAIMAALDNVISHIDKHLGTTKSINSQIEVLMWCTERMLNEDVTREFGIGDAIDSIGEAFDSVRCIIERVEEILDANGSNCDMVNDKDKFDKTCKGILTVILEERVTGADALRALAAVSSSILGNSECTEDEVEEYLQGVKLLLKKTCEDMKALQGV